MGFYDYIEKIRKMEAIRDLSGLISSLKYGDPNTRRAAADALGKLGDKSAISPLLSSLRDEKLGVRESVVEAIEKIGIPPDPVDRARYLVAKKDWQGAVELGEPSIEPLILAMKDKNSNICILAFKSLICFGKTAVEPLLHALGDNSSQVRNYAALALGGIGDVRAVEPLISSLEDFNSDVCWASARALENIGEPALKSLIKALKKDNWRVRKLVAEILGKIGSSKAMEPLILAMEDEKPYVRDCAVEALGNIRDKRAVEPIMFALKNLKNPWSSFSIAAVRALGRIGDTRVLEPLTRILNEGTPYFQETTKMAVNDIVKRNKELFNKMPVPVCPDCFCRFKEFKVSVSLAFSYSYIACSNCRGNSILENIGPIIAVFDRDMDKKVRINDSTLFVNWFEFMKPFDFDRILIMKADSFDIDSLILELHKDSDPDRSNRLGEIPVYISSRLELPPGKINLLKMRFKSLEVIDVEDSS
ncbi:MAG: HEAT repeat domain-containing protein [Candidatus Eremiobacteraeota bacterium]|nr:HEAT repeat domain-containing protein [Candidatus Eremiobacteraeota bacterium]